MNTVEYLKSIAGMLPTSEAERAYRKCNHMLVIRQYVNHNHDDTFQVQCVKCKLETADIYHHPDHAMAAWQRGRCKLKEADMLDQPHEFIPPTWDTAFEQGPFSSAWLVTFRGEEVFRFDDTPQNEKMACEIADKLENIWRKEEELPF